jgi:hypothetical protein
LIWSRIKCKKIKLEHETVLSTGPDMFVSVLAGLTAFVVTAQAANTRYDFKIVCVANYKINVYGNLFYILFV